MDFFIGKIKAISPPHLHSDYEIIVYFRGSLTLCLNGKSTSVSAGSIAVIPPGTTHSSIPKGDCERIYIRGNFNHIFTLGSPAVIKDNEKKDGLALAKMIYENRHNNTDYVAALCNAFAHFILQNLIMEDNCGGAVRKIISLITENFHNSSLDLGDILKKSGYAEDYIRVLFKKITGRTPTEFLTYVRISHARYLMEIYKDTLLLSQIAESCGYTDYAYFSKKFKQITGAAPREYIKQCDPAHI